jgi:hypothetical protein
VKASLFRLGVVAAVSAVICLPAEAGGQSGARPSQHGTVTQTVRDTEISIVYNRPVA